MSKRWYLDKKKEHYYKMAKEYGYRSRASYKLIQINERYKIINRGDCVIDLGAAPGGWSQVALSIIGKKGMVIGIDKEYISPPLPPAVFIRGDIMEDSTLNKLREVMKENGREGANAVISDMAPDISGNYSIDHAISIELSRRALFFAEEMLINGGNFLVKLFQGDMFKDYLNLVRKKFSFCKAHSPKASRKSSSEMYIVARGFNK